MASSGTQFASNLVARIWRVWVFKLTLCVEMPIRHGILGPKLAKTQRTDTLGNTHPEPPNGLVNTVARFAVARLNKGQPVFDRISVVYTGKKNAYEIAECPDSEYDMWDCCFIQLFSYEKKQEDDDQVT